MQIYNKYFNLPNYFAFFCRLHHTSLKASVGFTLHFINILIREMIHLIYNFKCLLCKYTTFNLNYQMFLSLISQRAYRHQWVLRSFLIKLNLIIFIIKSTSFLRCVVATNLYLCCEPFYVKHYVGHYHKCPYLIHL